MKKLVVSAFVIFLIIGVACGISAEEYTVKRDFTICTRTDMVDENMVLLGLEKLPTPKNLKWNPDGRYGWIQWDAVDNCEGVYEYIIYCDGEQVAECEHEDMYDHDGDGSVSTDIIIDDALKKDGIYTFSVRAIGDEECYLNSDFACSGEYEYKLPEKVLDTPKNVRWNESGIVVHDAVENAGGYYYVIYNQDFEDVGGCWSIESFPLENKGEVCYDIGWYLEEIAFWEEDFDTAYVTVMAITYNIEKFQNSEETEFSQGYDISAIGIDIEKQLEYLIEDMYIWETSAEEVLLSFLNKLEDSGKTNVDLVMSMIQSEDMVSMIAELERAYAEEMGVDVLISDGCDDQGYLGERGIEIEKVSVVGGALNSDEGQDVNVRFSEADKSISADELYFKNSVAVDISAEGVKDSQKLEIPMQITMPIPKGVMAERLIILHYHQDGTVEEIHPYIHYENNDVYARFVVSSFSTFIFCNEATKAVTVRVQEEKVELQGDTLEGTVAAVLIDGNGFVTGVKSYDVSEHKGVIDVDFDSVKKGDTIKLMWWNSLVEMNPVDYSVIVNIEN